MMLRSGVGKDMAIGQLPTSLKGIAQAYFEMLPIAQCRYIGGGTVRLGKARDLRRLGLALN